MADTDNLEARLSRKRAWANFLEFVDPADGWSLSEQIVEDMLQRNEKTQAIVGLKTTRLDVYVHRVRAWNPDMLRQLLERPAEQLPGFQDAIKDFARGQEEMARFIAPDTEVLIGIKGEFGDLELSPRELCSRHLGKLVKVYGIVTKCSLVRPKIVKSVHYCPDTKVTTTREYRDVTALVGIPTGEGVALFACLLLVHGVCARRF